MAIKKGISNTTGFNQNDINNQAKAEIIAEDFTAFLNEFHSYPQPYDDPLDAWLHGCYAKVKTKRQFFDFNTQPHFSPSSANSDDRELYEKVLKAKRDTQLEEPHRRRWTALGTAIGDLIQREVLLAERHFEKFTGKAPRFKMARTEHGYPFFEDFVKTMKVITHNGKKFSLFGTGDGVLEYVDDDGEIIRVGLEIKSKQTTHAQTSYHSMKEAKEDHVKQVTCYSIMYDVDYYIILYVNASKKGWFMTDEDKEKYPDIRAFGIYVTEEMKQEVLDKFAGVIDAVDKKQPPKLALDKWIFNNFKQHIAKTLTDDEIADLAQQVARINASHMPAWKKQQLTNAFEEIKELRANG